VKKILVAALLLMTPSAAFADVSASKLQEVYNVSVEMCPAVKKAVDTTTLSNDVILDTTIRVARSNGYNEEEINLLLKFCTLYFKGLNAR
jgi:hypothetical protein